MARMIKFKANCYYCGKECNKGEAFLQRTKGQWFANCFECYKEKKLKEEKERKDKMKTTMILIVAPLLITACGKKNSSGCKTREQKAEECFSSYVSRYHHPAYARQVCNQKYQTNKCYK